MSTPERRAYRDAWRARQETGDTAPSLLLDRLRANDAAAVWLDPDAELHKWLLDCWDRGLTPRELKAEAWKKIGGLIPKIVQPLREVFKQLQ